MAISMRTGSLADFNFVYQMVSRQLWACNLVGTAVHEHWTASTCIWETWLCSCTWPNVYQGLIGCWFYDAGMTNLWGGSIGYLVVLYEMWICLLWEDIYLCELWGIGEEPITAYFKVKSWICLEKPRKIMKILSQDSQFTDWYSVQVPLECK
jgi:hypothetical protein